MGRKISSIFFMFFLGLAFSGQGQAMGLQNVRCLLLLVDGEKQCWRSGSVNSLPRGVPIEILGLRPRQGGGLSVKIYSVSSKAESKSLLSSHVFGDVAEIPKDHHFFEISVLQRNQVIFQVPFRSFIPKFYYAVIGVNGKERVLANGSKTTVTPASDFEIKQIKTNLHKGVSVKVTPRSSREDELQVHYRGEIIGRMYFQKRGNL